MNELTTITKLIEERLAALVEAVANQEAKVRQRQRELNHQRRTNNKPWETRKFALRLFKARFLLERLRGRFEEADKTYTLIKAHENAEDGSNG